MTGVGAKAKHLSHSNHPQAQLDRNMIHTMLLLVVEVFMFHFLCQVQHIPLAALSKGIDHDLGILWMAASPFACHPRPNDDQSGDE